MVRRRLASGRGCTVAAMLTLALATIATSPSTWARGGGHFGGGFGGGHAGYAGHGGFGHGHAGGHFWGGVAVGSALWSLYPYAYYPYYPYYAYPSTYAYGPAIVQGNSVPPPAPVWYYCDAAANFYPYVSTCPGPWREVPATPPASGPAQ